MSFSNLVDLRFGQLLQITKGQPAFVFQNTDVDPFFPYCPTVRYLDHITNYLLNVLVSIESQLYGRE